MIERYLLRYFLAVVDQGNFSRAAEQCGVSQPTLSVGVAKLETLAGQILFNRTSRRVELTRAGTQFAEYARRIEAEFARVEHALRQTSAQKFIRMGIVSTLPSNRIEAALLAAGGVASEQIEVIEEPQRELLRRLDIGRVDVVLGQVENDHRDVEILFEEGYGLAMAPTHALAGCKSVMPEDVASEVMLVRRHCEVLPDVSRFFTQRGIRPFFAARTTSDDRALAYVRAGLGVTVMPHCYSGSGVAMAELSGFDLRRRIGLIMDRASRPRVKGSRALELFMESIAASHLSGQDHWAVQNLNSVAIDHPRLERAAEAYP